MQSRFVMAVKRRKKVMIRPRMHIWRFKNSAYLCTSGVERPPNVYITYDYTYSVCGVPYFISFTCEFLDSNPFLLCSAKNMFVTSFSNIT